MKRWLSDARLRADWRLWGLAATLLISAAVLGLGALVFHQREVDLQRRESVEQSYIRRAHMMRVFSLVQDVETSGRGFAMSGIEGFLDPLWKAKKLLPAEMARLKQDAIAANEEPSYARLEALVNLKLQLSAGLIERKRIQNSQGGTPATGSGRGRQAMDEIRSLLGAWEERERRKLEARIAAGDRADRALTAGLAALSAAVATLVALTVAGAALMMRSTARAARELEKSRDEAEEANRAKSAFLTMMSHELRTPLNGVLGMTHVLGASKLDAQQRAHLEIIDSSGRNLLMILNDLLDLSKIDAEKLEIECVPYALEDLLASTVSLWKSLAAEKGLTLDMELDGRIPRWIMGDPTRLRQVITNLLSNAVKFTEQGEIRMRVGADDGRLTFEVTDTGPGIPSGVESRLFVDFSQADTSISRRFGGTGLGLSISRKLCRLMGGDLTVSSFEGRGATFHGWVSLAVTEPVAAPVGGDNLNLPRLRVLAVDDHPANRAVAEALLSAFGMSVTLASDGAEALDILGRQPIDLVFMDINMPVMDGVQAVQAIRAGKAGDPAIPVIALTANAMVDDREKYLVRGFNDYLAKPIQPALLAMAVSVVAKRLAADRAQARTEPESSLALKGRLSNLA